jgi:hypothetical protein
MRKKNHGRLDFDKELISSETWHPDPRGTRRYIAERSFKGAANGLTFVNVTLFDVQPQGADLIKLCTN